MTIKSAALYARVSSKMQAEHGNSLESQIAACKDKAASLGAETTKEYIDDGYSGAYLERPALDALRDALRDRLHDAVIVYDPDRLSRNLAHQLLLTEEIEKLGAKLVFVSTEVQDTPEGKMLYQMRGVFAAYEREKFRERSMRGRRSLAKKGLVVQDSHVYGYDYDKDNRRYVVNEAEAKIIRMIYDLYLNDTLGGLHKIHQYLNQQGIPSPGGKLWGVSIVRDILRRRMYGGEFYAGRSYHTKKDAKREAKIPRPETEWIKIDCPAIVPLEYVERATELLAINRVRHYKRYETLPVMLQGVVYCKKCGNRCYVKSGPFQNREKTDRIRYYSCWNVDRLGRKNECDARMIRADELDDLVWSALSQMCKSKTNLEKYLKARQETKQKKGQNNDLKSLKSKLDRLATERKTVMTWYAKNLIEQSDATDRLAAIRQQEESIKRKIAAAVQTKEADGVDAAQIVREVKSCPPDILSRRAVVRAIVERVYAERTDTNTSQIAPHEIAIKIVLKAQ